MNIRNEKDMVKATQLLREAEKEFGHGQHPQPYIFPESPGHPPMRDTSVTR